MEGESGYEILARSGPMPDKVLAWDLAGATGDVAAGEDRLWP